MYDHLLSRRGRLSHPWSTVTPPPLGTISFGGGIPDPDSLPINELKMAAIDVLEYEGVGALQYGGSYGDLGLREELAARSSNRHGVELSPENILITTGSSQALDTLCTVLLDPGDLVLTEEPTFTGSLWTFRSHGAQLIPLPMDDSGIGIDTLRERLAAMRRDGFQPKLIYTTPDYQNPTGVSMSLSRRYDVLELAAEHGCLVVEDTAYQEIHIDEGPAPSLLSLAPSQVVQMGTFSKTIGPGLRVGWLQGATEIVAYAARARTDMGSSVTLSRVLARFLQQGSLDSHLDQVRRLYRSKRDTLVRALRENLEGYAKWQEPRGGFFLWLSFLYETDTSNLLNVAREERVSFIPGFRFLVDERPIPTIRLAFSQVSLNEISEGIERLGQALHRLGHL